MRLIEKDGEFTQNIALVTYDITYIISGITFVQYILDKCNTGDNVSYVIRYQGNILGKLTVFFN